MAEVKYNKVTWFCNISTVLSELHCCRDQRIGLETKYQKKWHTPILPPPLLNSYFKPKTQRLEICKNFWKGHSINWTSGNFFLRNSFLDFVSPHEDGVQRQVQTLLGSAPGSAPLLRDAQFSAFPSPTHSHVFSRRVCCVFPPQQCSHCYWNSSSCFEPHPLYVQINLLVLMTVLLYHLLRLACIL